MVQKDLLSSSRNPETFVIAWPISMSGQYSPDSSSKNPSRHQSDDSDGNDSHGPHPYSDSNAATIKPAYACTNCKRLKVKCEFTHGAHVCKRCQSRRLECLPRERKKRPPAPSHEELQQQSNARTRRMESLLVELDQQKKGAWVRDVLSKGGFHHNNEYNSPPEWECMNYFPQPLQSDGPNVTHPSCPDIVKFCELYPDQIIELFNLFFERVNVFFSILDPNLHTPEYLIWNRHFLFTVICATASRYYTKRPELQSLAVEFAKDAATKALIHGPKTVDVCQAFLMMAVYPQPKKKWVEDNSWVLIGHAVRLAIHLGLNVPPPPNMDELNKLDRTRTWLNGFCVDLSYATQSGKIPLVAVDDYMARTSREWYRSSPLNLPIDVHLCAYVEMLIIMGTFYAQRRVCRDSQIEAIVLDTEKRIVETTTFWVSRYMEHPHHADPVCSYRMYTSKMIGQYLRLTILSVGFQHASKTGISRDSSIFQKSIHAAQTVINIMIRNLYPTGNLRYAMEAHFLYVSFAAAFLLNLLSQEFSPLLNQQQKRDIISLVQNLVQILGSEHVAMHGRHTPALYSRFLDGLLTKHHLYAHTAAASASPTDYTASQASPQWIPWPYTQDGYPHAASNSSSFFPFSTNDRQSEPGMDLSLPYFLQSVHTYYPYYDEQSDFSSI